METNGKRNNVTQKFIAALEAIVALVRSHRLVWAEKLINKWQKRERQQMRNSENLPRTLTTRMNDSGTHDEAEKE